MCGLPIGRYEDSFVQRIYVFSAMSDEDVDVQPRPYTRHFGFQDALYKAGHVFLRVECQDNLPDGDECGDKGVERGPVTAEDAVEVARTVAMREIEREEAVVVVCAYFSCLRVEGDRPEYARRRAQGVIHDSL